MIRIYDVTEERFKEYGRVIPREELDISDMLSELSKLPLLEEGTFYEASSESLERCDSLKMLESMFFGGMEIQAGYCGGHNKRMDAMEYHKSSEINASNEDIILFLGKRKDISEDLCYSSERVEAFKVPKGTVLEIYSTTLHYSPCHVEDKGFAMLVILPKGSNTELCDRHRESIKRAHGEAKLLFAKNKWLLAHPEAHIKGAYEGIEGENLTI